MRSGLPQGFVLSSVICNFTLAYLTNNFFVDPFFLKNFKGNSCSIQINRFLICYGNDLMIKVVSPDEADYALKKLRSKLFNAGLRINSKNIHSYDFSTKAKFY